jgi:hypothetical protein
MVPAANGIAGDDSAGRLCAPIAPKPAEKSISQKKNAARSSNRYVEDVLSHLNHWRLTYYLLSRTQEFENGQ